MNLPVMKLYLSSFRVGNQPEKLVALAGSGPLGFIPNALDHVEEHARRASNETALQEVLDLGVEVLAVDLQRYFGNSAALERRLTELSGVWVRGGNTFVLRQAMRLSGFDVIVKELRSADFLYAGYSAGICVLAPSLNGLQHVDDPTIVPYPNSQVTFRGLGLLDYLILPHYKSNHPESANIDREVEYCREQGIPFRTLSDGEVIVIENLAAERSG